MVNDMIKSCQSHIDRIENHLSELYTINCPEGYNEQRCKDGKINVNEELKRLKMLESLYSVIEKTENKKGHLYSEYSNWLVVVRESKEVIEKELKKVREKHIDDIKNAELLISKFKKFIKINSTQ